MTQPVVGQPAPEFSLADADGRVHRLEEFRGQHVVLYFYPKDDTPGCTVEACDFRDHGADFAGRNAVIVGVSGDSSESHRRFMDKYGLPFLLLADPEKKTLAAYGVLKEKTTDGKTRLSTERSTFLIDPQGVLRAEYRGVKVDGHVAEVLAALG
jgi:peroxiredoxin Q/BCP